MKDEIKEQDRLIKAFKKEFALDKDEVAILQEIQDIKVKDKKDLIPSTSPVDFAL